MPTTPTRVRVYPVMPLSSERPGVQGGVACAWHSVLEVVAAFCGRLRLLYTARGVVHYTRGTTTNGTALLICHTFHHSRTHQPGGG